MKNRWMSFALVAVMLLALASLAGCGDNSDGSPGKAAGKEKVKITATETSKIKYEKFDNGMVSLDIPKGWKTDVPSAGYASYTFKVYDPQDANYMFLFCLKFTGFLKSEAARAKFASLYPSASFGKLAAIDPQTTEAFYKVWNKNARIANSEQLKYDYFPCLDEFTVIENLGQIPLGGDVLRATFKNDKGELMEGLFTSTVVSSGTYKMYGLDFAPLDVYHNIMMMTPDAEFNNWQAIMDHCIGTVQFSEEFMKGFNREQQTTLSTVKANAKIYDEISGMIMDSWEKRNNSYDIISQKRSDATLGYERVYDTETGDVYRAYNGFTDEYAGDRYQSITDDMYTEVISGYIER